MAAAGGPLVWVGLAAVSMLGSGAYINVACRRQKRRKKSDKPVMPKEGVGKVGVGATLAMSDAVERESPQAKTPQAQPHLKPTKDPQQQHRKKPSTVATSSSRSSSYARSKTQSQASSTPLESRSQGSGGAVNPYGFGDATERAPAVDFNSMFEQKMLQAGCDKPIRTTRDEGFSDINRDFASPTSVPTFEQNLQRHLTQ